MIGRGNKGADVNDYWFRIFSTASSSWATPWVSLGTASPDDPIVVAPSNTNTYNLLFVYCRGGGDHALYERTIVLERPTSGVPGQADTAWVTSPQWEGLPDSGNMPMTANVTYVQTPRGQDQVWGFLRGASDNAVYYTTMNIPSSPTCAPDQTGAVVCRAPTRFTYDARGNFTGVGGQISFNQNPSGGFYNGIPGAVISPQSKPVAGWLRVQGTFGGAVMMVGRGNDTAYYYAVFNQATNQWVGMRGIPGGAGFETDPELNDANHFSIRLMGRGGTTLFFNSYNHLADIWASANAGYFNVGTGFASKPVLFNND